MTSREEIAINDPRYWTHPPELRGRYTEKAEVARKKWDRVRSSLKDKDLSPEELRLRRLTKKDADE